MQRIIGYRHRSGSSIAVGVSILALSVCQSATAQQAQPVAGDVAKAGNVAAPTQTAAANAAAPTTVDPAQDTQATGTEITVTGSRIQRRDADNVGPLLTLTSDDIAKSGASSIGDLLQKLPSAGVSLNSNGTQGTSYGASSINLRYLGGAEGSGNRVLVLVDGHRWVDAVGQRGFRDFVDLNTIPLGMIDGIEVLKDGASAIYGADAIAGVVNIKTIQPFDGIRGSARAGVTDEGDGAEYNAILNVGKRFGRLSVLASASYYKSEPILTSDRALTATSLVPVTTPGTSPNGLYILPGLAGNAYFGTAAGFANTTNPIAFNGGTGFGAAAQADNSYHLAALPGDYYNTQAQGIYSTGAVATLRLLRAHRLRSERRPELKARGCIQPPHLRSVVLARAPRHRRHRRYGARLCHTRQPGVQPVRNPQRCARGKRDRLSGDLGVPHPQGADRPW